MPVVPTPAAIRAWAPSQPPPATSGTAARWWLVAAAVVLVACAIGVGVQISDSTGEIGFVIGATLAILPVPALVAAFRWLDQYEPEPTRDLVIAFAWGAAVATLAALFLNTRGAEAFFVGPGEDGLEGAAVYIAPPVEEFFKGAIVVIFALRRRIDGVLDGIVVAGLSAVGFAFTENILYFGRAFADGSDQLGAGTGVLAAVLNFAMRGIVMPFAHPLFTVSIGIAVGLAVRHRSLLVKILLPLGGYAIAMLLHGLWNGAAVRGFGDFAIGYVAIMLPALAVAVFLAIVVRRREGRVITRRLPPFAEQGWIAPHEVALLSSLELRGLALDLARQAGGKPARAATRAYQHHVVRLAFLRERLAGGRRLDEGLAEQDAMLAALPALRSQALVPPPPPPPRPPGWVPPPPAPMPYGWVPGYGSGPPPAYGPPGPAGPAGAHLPQQWGGQQWQQQPGQPYGPPPQGPPPPGHGERR